MFPLTNSLLTIFATIFLVTFSNFPVLAKEMWQGRGRIIDGEGEGASVGLKILVKDNQVTFLTGASKGQQIELTSTNPLRGEADTEVGKWRFLETNEELAISLSQNSPYRLIRYRLFLAPECEKQ